METKRQHVKEREGNSLSFIQGTSLHKIGKTKERSATNSTSTWGSHEKA